MNCNTISVNTNSSREESTSINHKRNSSESKKNLQRHNSIAESLKEECLVDLILESSDDEQRINSFSLLLMLRSRKPELQKLRRLMNRIEDNIEVLGD